MSEETTHNLPDSRSFEERVFARFDALDVGIRDLNVRVERLEAESQRRAADTKPIWERALAEIAGVKQDIASLSQDVAALSQKVETLDKKVDALTVRVEIIEHKMDALASDMLTLRGQQKRLETRMDNLESKPVP